MSFRSNQDFVPTLFLLVVLFASAGDISEDMAAGVPNDHFVQEVIIVAVSIIGLVWLLIKHRRQKSEIQRLQKLIEQNAHQQEASEALVKAKKGLSEAIKVQFADWQFTPSEQEVGLMLLKGFSVKEISLLRGTTEKTVRHHASAIYQKGGLSGRHAFSAWFIEDYL